MKQLFENKIIFSTLLAVISFYVLIVFVKNPGMNTYDRAMFHDVIYGTAYKPYVYRMIAPAAIRTITTLIPVNIQDELSRLVENNGNIKAVMDKFHWESKEITEYLVACLLLYLFLIVFLFTFKKLFGLIYSAPEWFANIVTVFTLFGLTAMFEYYSYVYDFPALFFFTLGLVFILLRRWKAFLVLYSISCFNKETTILLTLVFAVYNFRNSEMEKYFYRNMILVQLAVFTAIRVLLYFIFIDNPGGMIEVHLFDRTYLLWNGYTLTTFVIWLVIILLVFSNWREKPKFLKDALWIAVPLILFTFSLGVWDEWRDYYEVYPVIALLSAYTVAKIVGVDIRVAEHNHREIIV
jgi:hypothetical protein